MWKFEKNQELLNWPKTLGGKGIYTTLSYRVLNFIKDLKKVEKDEAYQKTIIGLGSKVEQIIRQNNAIARFNMFDE